MYVLSISYNYSVFLIRYLADPRNTKMSMRNMVERGNPVSNIPTEKGGKFKTDALMKYIDVVLVLFSTTYVAAGSQVTMQLSATHTP